jgi:hypothetical protein
MRVMENVTRSTLTNITGHGSCLWIHARAYVMPRLQDNQMWQYDRRLYLKSCKAYGVANKISRSVVKMSRYPNGVQCLERKTEEKKPSALSELVAKD